MTRAARPFAATLAALSPSHTPAGLDAAVQRALDERYDAVLVLDDDPTGTQTVHDVPVITGHTAQDLSQELSRGSRLIYVLTNSRAMTTDDVRVFAEQLGRTIRRVAMELDKRLLTIIRGDSTLRGHFPVEDDALAAGLGWSDPRYGLIPAFFEGGRYTIGNVHYVREGNELLPASQTPFAQDATFGYRNADLPAWVEEKTAGRIRRHEVNSVSIEDLRTGDEKVAANKFLMGKICIVNAADYADLKKAALALTGADARMLLRTSASFIKAILGKPDRPLLQLRRGSERGGLVLVGSHVPKSTAQLAHLRKHTNLTALEIDVPGLVSGADVPSPEALAGTVDDLLADGADVVLYTSRELVRAEGKAGNLRIARLVSAYTRGVIRHLTVFPAFLLTKGGITSSEVATEALGVRRAMVLGQVLPGVPAWELGPESKYPGLPFIIFPGNVGAEESLTRIVKSITP